LQAGEAALFYSDGLVEAHNPQGEMFGFPRLRSLVAKYGKERSLGDSLLEELYSFRRGGVGAGGRHHPPYAEAFGCEPLKVRSFRFHRKRSWVSEKIPSETV
jgi:hypothetical protein